MAKFSLHIETEELTELHTLVARMANGAASAPIAEAPVTVTEAPAAAAPKTRVKKEEAKASAPEPVETNTVAPAPVAQAAPASSPSAAPSAGANTSVAPAADPAPSASPASSSTGGTVTYEELKAALSKLMEAKGAKFAQDTLKKSVGFGSLSSTPPEKYGDALRAINEGLGA